MTVPSQGGDRFVAALQELVRVQLASTPEAADRLKVAFALADALADDDGHVRAIERVGQVVGLAVQRLVGREDLFVRYSRMPRRSSASSRG